MIQIQDMFENGKPDIVLKTVKGFHIRKKLINLNKTNLIDEFVQAFIFCQSFFYTQAFKTYIFKMR